MADVLVVPPMFTRDVMEMPSADHITRLEELSRQSGGGTMPTYKALPARARGVRLQITALQVMSGLGSWLGRPAATGVYVVSSVCDGIGDQPITFQGKVYQGVREGELLPLGRGAGPNEVFNVYLHEGTMPRLLSFSLLAVRSNEGLHEIGRVLGRVVRDERYKELSQFVGTAMAAANPVYSTVWQAADEAMSLVGELLASKPDEQLGYYQANYTNLFDNLGMGKHPADRPTLEAGRVRLGYEIDVL